ncbi:hypothetical protein ACOME3_001989 [Neoechinorhynchus agilis]
MELYTSSQSANSGLNTSQSNANECQVRLSSQRPMLIRQENVIDPDNKTATSIGQQSVLEKRHLPSYHYPAECFELATVYSMPSIQRGCLPANAYQQSPNQQRLRNKLNRRAYIKALTVE